MGQDVPIGPLTSPEAAPAAPHAPPRRSHVRDYFEVVLVAVVFALFVRTFLLQAFVVPTPSMEKTVLVGDHLIVNKFLYAPHVRSPLARLFPFREIRRGDVFVFKFPEDPQRDFIKRVVALPGDRIEIRDKRLGVNGRPESDPHISHEDARVWPDDPSLPDGLRRRDQLAPTSIPESSYFAMGDNRDNSYDSRFWGPVPTSNVKGRALFVYWSFPPNDGAPTNWLGWVARLVKSTRWSRTLMPVK